MPIGQRADRLTARQLLMFCQFTKFIGQDLVVYGLIGLRYWRLRYFENYREFATRHWKPMEHF